MQGKLPHPSHPLGQVQSQHMPREHRGRAGGYHWQVSLASRFSCSGTLSSQSLAALPTSTCQVTGTRSSLALLSSSFWDTAKRVERPAYMQGFPNGLVTFTHMLAPPWSLVLAQALPCSAVGGQGWLWGCTDTVFFGESGSGDCHSVSHQWSLYVHV